MFTPLLGVLALATLWSAYWFVGLTYARQEITSERLELAEKGLSLSCSEESWGGYPFRFEFACTKPLLTAAGLGEIATDRVLVMALAYNPKQIVLLSDGPVTTLKSAVHEVSVLHGRVVASLTFDKEWKPSFAAEVPRIEIPQLLTAKKVALFTRPVPDKLAGLALNVEDLRWQRPGRPELRIDAGQMTGSLTPGLALQAERIELASGSVRYWGSGAMQLDDERRPSGTLSTETNDLNGLLDILDPHLLMSDQDKANLRMVLGLLGQQAKASLTFSGGAFFIGPYRVSDLPPLY